MSNLGKYQEFTTEAKGAGGVENFLKLIEADAIARATPELYARAVAATLVAAAGLSMVGFRVDRWLKTRARLGSEAGAAREELRAAGAHEPAESPSVESGLPGVATDAEPGSCCRCGQPDCDTRCESSGLTRSTDRRR